MTGIDARTTVSFCQQKIQREVEGNAGLDMHLNCIRADTGRRGCGQDDDESGQDGPSVQAFEKPVDDRILD
jgi:hypothetical protein